MSHAGAECDHCRRELLGRIVILTLDAGARRRFCSDACESKWLRSELIRLRRYMRRIWLISRGDRIRELGRLALQTDEEP